MKDEIHAMQLAVLDLLPELGGMAENLKEAADWADDSAENALCTLESVSAGAVEITEKLRAIALKCEELCGGESEVPK